VTTVGVKRCKKCGRNLPWDRFSAKADAGDRFDPWCKPCRKISSARAGRARNEAVRRLIANHPDEWRTVLAEVNAELS